MFVLVEPEFEEAAQVIARLRGPLRPGAPPGPTTNQSIDMSINYNAPVGSQRFVGSVHDDLVLDERDVLRSASMPVRS